jgi:nitroimidazol reductase NimA-like FMN-containing flavoprotein (pyridoxamine 5'-phosphate oxidase superfamily)
MHDIAWCITGKLSSFWYGGFVQNWSFSINPSTLELGLLRMEHVMTDHASYPITPTNRIKRAHERAAYDHESVHRILDAAALCHVAYVIDDQPYATPTMFWREGSRLYWHGSAASRMIKTIRQGVKACVTVTHFDGLVIARSGFHHSANYRTVMAFGTARLLDDPDEKFAAQVAMVDRLFPGRTAELREVTEQELKATSFIYMDIESAAAKVRTGTVKDDEDDYALPIHAEVIPIHTTLGTPEPCPRSHGDAARGDDLRLYQDGVALEDALSQAYQATFD